MLYMISGDNDGVTAFVTEVEYITLGVPAYYCNNFMVFVCSACIADSH